MALASTQRLVIMSALCWYGGGSVLLLKGSTLALEAHRLEPGGIWPWLIVFSGVSMGMIKARYIFSGSCRKNLARIRALKQPKWWQFFRPGFFVFLGLMMIAGATLSRVSHDNYPFLLGVALLDFSIAVSLLGSSYVFWTKPVRAA